MKRPTRILTRAALCLACLAGSLIPGGTGRSEEGLSCADDWPQFRGPDGQGHAAAAALPLTWSEQENVAWKVAIPGLGWSSPVIQGGRIWLTTALDDGKSL